MKRKSLISLLLIAALLLSLVGCGTSYEGDERIGSYVAYAPDGERVEYRLTLNADGEGEMIRYPIIGGEEKEEIFFTFEGETLTLHGTEEIGGVIGRNEFLGSMVHDGSKYTVELRSIDSSVPLALFVQE